MALTATAALVVTPDSGWNPDPPEGHEGWDNTSGDKSWVPDDQYYRRVLLTLTADSPGELGNGIVNWEIYDGTAIPFVDDASTVEVTDTAGGSDYTQATAPAFLNDRTTRTIWARNATPGNDAPIAGAYYDDTGTPLVSSLRANGPRTVIEFPAYLKWDPEVGPDSMDFEVAAFLPGSFGKPSATTSITISRPDSALIGQPRPKEEEPPILDDPDPDPDPEPEPEPEPEPDPKRRKKKKADDEPLG